jgi:hypothetical protein
MSKILSWVCYQGRSVDEVNSCGDLKSNTGEAVYVKRNGEACSYNHRCYSECVSVALGIQHVTRMRRVFICDLPGSTTYLHIIS